MKTRNPSRKFFDFCTLTRTLLGFITVALLAALPAKAQDIYPESFYDSFPAAFVWLGGNGDFNDIPRWDYTGNDLGGLYYFRDLGGVPEDLAGFEQADFFDAYFANTTANPYELTLSTNVLMGKFYFAQGDFTFNLGNNTLKFVATQSASPFAADAHVVFRGPGIVHIALNGGFDAGADGSSNNTVTGLDSITVPFNFETQNGATVQKSLASNTVTIGAASSGTNNTVRIDAGSDFDGASLGSVVVNAGNAAGESNNRFEINGATVQTGEISIEGRYDASDPDNIIKANNQFLIQQNGSVKAPRVDVGAGSEMRVETGGKLILEAGASVAQLNVLEHGLLVLDGEDGSQIGATVGFNLNIAGRTEITDGAGVFSNLRTLSVASTGHLIAENTTAEGQSFSVSGLAELKNAHFTFTGGLSVGSGGRLEMDGDSQVNAASYSSGGGTFDVKGNSEVNLARWGGFAGSSGITVEEGSTFRFETLNAVGEQKYTLSANGKVIWGGGGVTGGLSHDGKADFDLTVAAGTTLVLEAGNTYRMSVSEAAPGMGKLIVKGGLEGSGEVVGSVEFHGGSHIDIAGTTPNDPGLLSMGNLDLLNGTSQISFTIFAADAYDRFALDRLISASANDLEIRLTLGSNLLEMTDEEFALYVSENFLIGETSFQLFSTQSGEAFDFGSHGDTPFFTFDSASAARLAANGLGWDTSAFASTGAVGIAAVPEPSTYALLGLGLAGVLWRMRKRRVSAA